MREKLLVIVGPTAVGKSKIALKIAKRFNGEIISGDSIQVYRGLDIGTAKITTAEMQGIRHHLIDIHDPDYYYSVAEFQRSAKQLITEINQRGCLPIIVGGTGLYIKAITENYNLPELTADLKLREELSKLSKEELYNQLCQHDPVTAKRLHPNDQKRIIRALEVYHQLGKPISQLIAEQQTSRENELSYDQLIIGLDLKRQLLYERINKRVESMIEQGLVSEVESLKFAGYDEKYNSMQGIGYKEVLRHLAGESTLAEAVVMVQQATRNFAKRQLSLFRANDSINWFDLTEYHEKHDETILDTIYSLIAKRFQP
jgi:tRNA dimethylallyltransferase